MSQMVIEIEVINQFIYLSSVQVPNLMLHSTTQYPNTNIVKIERNLGGKKINRKINCTNGNKTRPKCR